MLQDHAPVANKPKVTLYMKLSSKIIAFTDEIENFSFELSSLDHVWKVLFPDKNKNWHHLHINKYKRAFYITHINGDGSTLEVEPPKSVKEMNLTGRSSHPIDSLPQLAATWELLTKAAHKRIKAVHKDWIKANKRIQMEYPLNYRYGIAPNALVRSSLPDIYHLDIELGEEKTQKLINLIEKGFFFRAENTEVSSMTANDYFDYCRIAYIAGKREDDIVDESLSGKKMYRQYADGRHEGLLDINPTSEQEFADWIDGNHPKRNTGGHPWEIKRGGNTTHIDLSVSRPSPFIKEGFKIELRGESIGRMVETMRMFLAIHDAGLPVSIANPEAVRKRLLAQDNIGIIPSYAPLHRANQHFKPDADVFDVMHYDDLGRFKPRITPFIAWEPLPILKPN